MIVIEYYSLVLCLVLTSSTTSMLLQYLLYIWTKVNYLIGISNCIHRTAKPPNPLSRVLRISLLHCEIFVMLLVDTPPSVVSGELHTSPLLGLPWKSQMLEPIKIRYLQLNIGIMIVQPKPPNIPPRWTIYKRNTPSMITLSFRISSSRMMRTTPLSLLKSAEKDLFAGWV